MATRLKHRWSVGQSFLLGISHRDWARLLRENRYAIDSVYLHRAALISLIAAIRAPMDRREERRHGKAIRYTEITEPPLFILGYWRSGTTHLHNLLAQDEEQFGTPNTFQAFNPRMFLTTEAACVRRFASLVPNKRSMDNVARTFQTPQEDEIALALVSGRSPYLGMAFPKREAHYDRYLTFDDATPAELEEWKAAVLWYVKKLTLKYRRAVILKSPPHTGRIRLLLELFPGARFVHIHRHPYTLFQSLRNHHNTAYWETYLQRPDLDGLEERMLARYNLVYDSFFAAKPLIPNRQFHEIGYEELERDPIGQLRGLYEALELSGFERFAPRARAYVESLNGYQKNRHRELDAGLRERIACTWERSFDAWRYPA